MTSGMTGFFLGTLFGGTLGALAMVILFTGGDHER